MSGDPGRPPPPRARWVVPAGDLARELVSGERFGPHVEAVREIPARPAAHGPWPENLHPAARAVAGAMGIERLYSHQAHAISAALDPSPAHPAIAVAAGTASGKSLCYTLPLLDARLRDERSRALLLFPTKALARDQLATLHAWDAALDSPALHPAAFDGDTPSGQRQRARRNGRLLLTNPDMLHAGILPHHPRWADFLSGLRWIVLDEMHVYRGVFGSHVANVLRRLRRVAAFHGAQPRYLLTSATIANPGDLGRRLTGRPTTVIDEDGAPRGARHFIFYNPPVIDPVLNLRRSAVLEADRIARHFLDGGVQTIVFARTRQTAELLTRYIAQGLGAQTDLPDGSAEGPIADDPNSAEPPIRGYRGGYTAGERRAIEAALREGRLRGVVATNALELGIDIGQLDACVMTGYPGTIASTWQQAGRAGRRGEEAAAVLVASAAPLDQYIVRHPDWVLGRSPEEARLDPDNLLILLGHLRCAAFELPFGPAEAAVPFGSDEEGTSTSDGAAGTEDVQEDDGAAQEESALNQHKAPAVADLLAVLEAQGDLRQVEGRWYWLAEGYPAEAISLRSAGAEEVAIVRGTAPEEGADPTGELTLPEHPTPGEKEPPTPAPLRPSDVLGTVDRGRAPAVVHEGAVYLHDGMAWRVNALDWETGRAYVSPADGATYTRASGRTDVTPVDVRQRRDARGAEVAHGELEVRSRVTGYRVLRFRTHETLGWGKVDLPEQRHVAGGYWCCLSEASVDRLRAIGRWNFAPDGDRGPDWPEARQRALERDEFHCRHCGAAPPPSRSHDVHHLKPWRNFGQGAGAKRRANQPENLITLCKACHAKAERALGLHGALTGVGFALSQVAPLFLMCDPGDLGVSAVAQATWTQRPTVVLYERAAAGVGFGEALFGRHEAIVSAAHALIAECPCPHGCPSCVGPADAASDEAKAHALAVLDVLR